MFFVPQLISHFGNNIKGNGIHGMYVQNGIISVLTMKHTVS